MNLVVSLSSVKHSVIKLTCYKVLIVLQNINYPNKYKGAFMNLTNIVGNFTKILQVFLFFIEKYLCGVFCKNTKRHYFCKSSIIDLWQHPKYSSKLHAALLIAKKIVTLI